MFGPDHYVPIVRGKQGEFHALRDLALDVRQRLTPIIELPPVSWDPKEAEMEELAPDPGIVGISRKIESSWGGGEPFFLDLGLVPSSPDIAGGVHPLTFIFNDARTRGLQGIPVTSLGRDSAFQEALAGVVASDGRGACIRLSSDDFDDLDGAMTEAIALLGGCGISTDQADLLLDFGSIAPDQTGPLVLAAVAVISTTPRIDEWRTVTWAATSFPAVQNFAPNSLNVAPRAEWAIWQSIQGRARSLPRLPSFGDYTVNGVQSDYDDSAAFFPSSPNLRYTADADFLIWKARHPRHGHDQFNDICRLAVRRPEFRGQDFSEGDAYLARCAVDEDGPGNGTTWRRVGVSHHLVEVADQIASPAEP